MDHGREKLLKLITRTLVPQYLQTHRDILSIYVDMWHMYMYVDVGRKIYMHNMSARVINRFGCLLLPRISHPKTSSAAE